jgi:hypothetical protein
MNRVFRDALRMLQRRCDHAEMKVDILEGDCTKSVAWCETCGAVSIDGREIRMPEPTWHPFNRKMRHFHPFAKRGRMTVTVGADFRLFPSLSVSRRSGVTCGGFYASWLGVYVEYNHLSVTWLRAKQAA